MKFGAKDRFFNGPDVIGGLSKTDGKKISYSYYPPVFCELPGPITDRFSNLRGPIHKSHHGACFYYNSTIRNFTENSLEWSNVRGFVKPVPLHCH